MNLHTMNREVIFVQKGCPSFRFNALVTTAQEPREFAHFLGPFWIWIWWLPSQSLRWFSLLIFSSPLFRVVYFFLVCADCHCDTQHVIFMGIMCDTSLSHSQIALCIFFMKRLSDLKVYSIVFFLVGLRPTS